MKDRKLGQDEATTQVPSLALINDKPTTVDYDLSTMNYQLNELNKFNQLNELNKLSLLN